MRCIRGGGGSAEDRIGLEAFFYYQGKPAAA
jgi:hypothetical protein